MPYFAWRGITLQGTIKKGKQCARSQEDLDAQLFKKEIALLATKEIRYPYSMRMNTAELRLDFFEQFSTLLAAGILVPQALLLVAAHSKHPRFQDTVFMIADDVHQGSSLHDALALHPHIFDSMTLHMVRVGQETSSLVHALTLLLNYQTMVRDFRKKLRSAALMPCLTFIFFLCVAFAIFVFVIPRFATIFKAAHHELPVLTQRLIAVADFCTTIYAGIAIIALVVGLCGVYWYSKSAAGKQLKDRLLLIIPGIGSLVRSSIMSQWLRSVAMLLHGGMQLVPALQIAQEGVDNAVIKRMCEYLTRDVENGNSLTNAMARFEDRLSDDSLVAMIHVGEESANLGKMMMHAADAYQAQLHRSLMFMTTLFQPCFMIIMGLLITILIFAVYLPVFNMAHVVG